MMIRGLFHRHDMDHLKAGLEVTYQERLESSHNLVNGETPGFRAKNTDFRAMFMPGEDGDVTERGEGFQPSREALEPEPEFNLEREMRRMSQANLASQAYSKVLIRRYQDLRTVMREGR